MLTTCLLILSSTSATASSEPPASIKQAICAAFGPRCGEAVRVAGCETGGTFDIHAQNGRYWGLYQVSEHWRRTVPGFAWNAWAQARHAHRVFVKVGRKWSPHWSCAWAA
jgi:hypothetical protein